MSEHPFVPFIQMLGKGKRGARDLTQTEARQAMDMILAGQVEPVQLGAFLMLMRVKEETPAEVAGFVAAARATQPSVSQGMVDLDWACYAGKRRQLPWFLLAALLLASHGTKVLMHGLNHPEDGRVYLPQALQALGLEEAQSPLQAQQQLQGQGFSYLSLAVLNPVLQQLVALKPVLGLRSPVHTVIRMLNPFQAQASIMGIFHPGYDETHQQAALLLGDSHMAVFKGEGGEAERNPDGLCVVRLVIDGKARTQEWPPLFAQRHLRDEVMDCTQLRRVWEGTEAHEYGVAAVQSTAAIALVTMGHVASPGEGLQEATRLWNRRNLNYFSQ